MKLDQNERAIIAGFNTMEQAEKTAKALEQVETIDISIDRVSIHGVAKFEDRDLNPITGDFPGLANATYDDKMGRDSSVLAAAHPSASGMADGNDENVGMDVVLTVVVNANNYDKAAQIVRQNGGSF